jgi:3-oxoacyl-[acyl-carrier protein] reductase
MTAGRTILVTGAAQGIGHTIATTLAAEGAHVLACDINEVSVAGCSATRLDVTDENAVASLLGQVGTVDGLVHSAGGVMGQIGRSIEDVSLSEWRVVQDVNLTGAFLLARTLSPGMKARGHGRMVMISSGAGIDFSLTGIQSYASAKAGQLGLVRQLAHELGPFGITVNAIAPGFVRSNPSTERQWEALGARGQEALIERIALRRLGTPEDIAGAVSFFLSERASWITGQVLRVDGGK